MEVYYQGLLVYKVMIAIKSNAYLERKLSVHLDYLLNVIIQFIMIGISFSSEISFK